MRAPTTNPPTNRLAALALLTLLLALPATADANRPFMTDDAGISEVGEGEIHLFSELTYDANEPLAVSPILNAEVAFTPIRGLELTAGSGFGLGHDREWTAPNPTLEAKTLFLSPGTALQPGIAASLGIHPNLGFGEAYAPATHFYALIPLTFELPAAMALHANLGWVSAHDEDGFMSGRPLAGLGLEWAPGDGSLAMITEVFAGDPGDVGTGEASDFVEGPFAGQIGLRWEALERATFDAGLISDTDLDWTLHFGAVFVFETPLAATAPDDPALFGW